jgi:hypothetical protein
MQFARPTASSAKWRTRISTTKAGRFAISSWIEAVDWSTSKVSVDLTRHAIKAAPPYDAVAQFTREQEQGLYEHYGRTGYWIKAHHDETVPALK